MATNLQTPVLNNRTRSVNFFNGRLLTGEDLTSEQQSNRAARALLGQAIGSGVVYGLEVKESTKLSTTQTPVLTINKGLAVNRRGAVLLLSDNTDVSLVRPASATNASSTIFQDCTPVQSGVYVAGAGVYLLTVSPTSEQEGLAEVSGIGTATASCNSDYSADAVQFRLIQIDQIMGLTQSQLADANHLQNIVAYVCFGTSKLDSFLDNPFVTTTGGYGLLDQLRSAQLVTDCEVPLATLSWTVNTGLVFVDSWSVRRHISETMPSYKWPLFVGERRLAEGEAMFLQFQEQINDLLLDQSSPNTIAATQYFNYLPPVGILPSAGATASPGFTYQAFFTEETYHDPVYIRTSQVDGLVRQAIPYRPVSLQNDEAVWLYQIVQGTTVLPYIIFTNIDVPFLGQPLFDVSAWNFSNFV